MISTDKPILIVYTDQLASLIIDQKDKEAISFRYSMFRLALMICGITWVYFMLKAAPFAIFAGLLSIMIGFLISVSKQLAIDNDLKLINNKILIVKNEMSCLKLDHSCYNNGSDYIDDHHLYTNDLDVFGPMSLFGWINRARTSEGQNILAKWFLLKPTIQEIAKRRSIIEELEKSESWRLNFLSVLFEFNIDKQNSSIKHLKEDLQIDLGFSQGKVLTIYVFLMPAIWILLGIFYLMDIPWISTTAIWLFIFNLLIVGRSGKKVNHIQRRLNGLDNKLTKWANAVQLILSKDWQGSNLISLIAHHKSSNKDNAKSILSLNKIISRLDYRLNMALGVVIQGLFLWDLKCMKQLYSWKTTEEENLYKLIETVGMFEAFTSLSTWAYNHSDYAYPIIKDQEFELHAAAIHHPLILQTKSVGNDFEINKEEYISIITGSNMAGKSTFLRTIGINMVLAYTGTKVAAARFACPLVTITTYMRIKDVLEENVSTFKAELNRIKLILDIISEKEPSLILIDEMLRGTNSVDKLKGSISITKKLLDSKSYCLIATHDIKLAELTNEIQKGIKNYYFDIDYADEELVFDYKIKPGICQNFNASFLLKQLGIGE